MDELYRQWGRNIEYGRKVLDLSQDALAELCEVTQQTVSKWEAGVISPRDHHKVRLATALRQDVRQLFPLNRVVA